MKIALLIFMILAHIIDDYYLQGWLASAKTKNWWKKNAPDELYSKDYIMALFCHSLSWSIMVFLPILIYSLINNINLNWFYLAIPMNLVIHALVGVLRWLDGNSVLTGSNIIIVEKLDKSMNIQEHTLYSILDNEYLANKTSLIVPPPGTECCLIG